MKGPPSREICLHLHGGLPRTSTTSLQEVLAENYAQLKAAGILYPKRWRPSRAPVHHELDSLLNESLDSKRGSVDFERFLASHADQNVLISGEGLTGWLQPSEKLKALQRLLTSALKVMPTRFILTLRRSDEILTSLYLRRSALRGRLPEPAEALGALPAPNALFAGLRKIEDTLSGEVTYLKYDRCGAHNRRLIDAFGIPEPVRSDLRRQLEHAPRFNPQPSQKQMVSLLNVESLSRKAGVDLNASVLRRAYLRGELVFDDDQPCHLVDTVLGKSLHEAALNAARQEGFSTYIEFFADEDVASHQPTPLTSEILNELDIQRLVKVGSSPDGSS